MSSARDSSCRRSVFGLWGIVLFIPPCLLCARFICDDPIIRSWGSARTRREAISSLHPWGHGIRGHLDQDQCRVVRGRPRVSFFLFNTNRIFTNVDVELLLSLNDQWCRFLN